MVAEEAAWHNYGEPAHRTPAADDEKPCGEQPGDPYGSAGSGMRSAVRAPCSVTQETVNRAIQSPFETDESFPASAHAEQVLGCLCHSILPDIQNHPALRPC